MWVSNPTPSNREKWIFGLSGKNDMLALEVVTSKFSTIKTTYMTIAEKIAAMQQTGKSPVKSLVLTSAPAPEIKKTEEKVEERSLSQTYGQGINQVPLTASPETAAWHSALNSFSSELCIVNDPQNLEIAWLAIKMKDKNLQPILLHQFPFWEHPMTVRQNNDPF